MSNIFRSRILRRSRKVEASAFLEKRSMARRFRRQKEENENERAGNNFLGSLKKKANSVRRMGKCTVQGCLRDKVSTLAFEAAGPVK